MIGLLGALARPLLLALEPEAAHAIGLRALQNLPLPAAAPDPESLAVEAFGLRFANPLGMAAGFDKNAQVYGPLSRLGFGFVEIGTVTPLAQAGNPKPRMFRLPGNGAVINRLGFNGAGHAAALARLQGRDTRAIVGVNIGANKEATDRAADYVAGIAAFAPVASYFAINVSSPNTPGLRDLQAAAALDDLLARVVFARDAAAQAHGRRPVLLKIAPDLTLADLDDVVRIARARRVDGMIVSNTTVSRPAGLRGAAAGQAGGLSGSPLFALSTAMLAATFLRVERQFPLIGVGGIDSADAAFAKIAAGADLVQLYTALVFQGIGLVGQIKHGLAARLKQRGLASVSQAVGTMAADWG